MLRFIELRNTMEAAEQAFDTALDANAPQATIRKLEKAAAAAQNAYAKELNEGRRLKAQYDAIGDEDGTGVVNAGDTYDLAIYGDARFSSTEYWQCAIDSYQLMLDSAC